LPSSPTRRFWLLGVTAVAGALPVFLAVLKLQDETFRADFLSNLAATVLGLVVGIPVALELSRRQQAAEEANAIDKRTREEAGRKRKVLQLLRKELQENHRALQERVSQPSSVGTRVVLLPALKNELWMAFSDGGELEWIQDPSLVDRIAEAYYGIGGIIYLEERYFEATHFAGMRVAQSEPPEARILKYLSGADDDVTKAITGAVDAIDAALR